MTTATVPPPRAQDAPDRDVPECPYVGLVPFEEKDAAYFFGREDESDLIVANLTASRLTLLYAPSGVGKSSVLRAGVLPALHELAGHSYAGLGVPGAAVAYASSWREAPLETIAAAVRTAVKHVPGAGARENDARENDARVEGADAPPLSAWLREVLGQSGVSAIYLILDQFEEFFFYHPLDRGEDGLTAELGRILSARDLPVHVLLSMREDALAGLDRFEGRVPHLFDNYLRLEHLSREAARAAIKGPLDRYNRVVPPDESMSIEPGLIEDLLEQLRTGHVQVAPQGTAPEELASEALGSDDRGDIETPFLQLVLTRLWNQERAAGSSTLRRSTLEELGRAQTIVRSHLDNVMASLSPAQVDVAAAVFHHLVTPSGTKIALNAKDLADWSKRPESAVQDLLEALSGERRILRPVPPAVGVKEPPRYEIFHDVVGPAVLDWRRRYVAQRQQAEASRQQAEASRQLIAEREEARAAEQTARRRLRRARLVAAVMAVMLLAVAVLAVFVYRGYWDTQKQQALSAAAATLGTDPAKSLESAIEAYRIAPKDIRTREAVLKAASSPRSRVVAGPDPTVAGDRKPRVVGMEVTADGQEQHVIAYDAQGGVFVITGKDAVEKRASGPRAGVVTGAVSGDGSRVALAAEGGGVTIVDIRVTKEPVRLATPQVTSFSKVSWLDSENLVLVVTPNEDAATYNASTGELIARFPEAYDAIPAADGQHVVTSDLEKRLRVWNARTGEKIRESPLLEAVPQFLKRYNQSIVGLLPSGTRWAIMVWGWQQTPTPEPELHTVPLSSKGEVTDVEVDQKNDAIGIAMDKGFFRYSLPNPDRLVAPPAQVNWVHGSAGIRDGRWIATAGGDGRVLVWSGYKPNLPTYELLGHEGGVRAVRALRDGQVLVSLGFDGTVRWWDMDLPRVQRFDRHTDWILNADVSGSWLATAGRDGVYIVDLADLAGKPVVKSSEYMLDVRFDPADPHHFFTLEQYAKAPQAWRWEDDGSIRKGMPFDTPQLGSNDQLVSFDISRDGKTAAAGDSRGTIHLWDAATGTLLPHQLLQVPGGPAWDVAFDPSGQFLAAVGQQGIHLWKRGSGKPLALGHLSNATTVTFNPKPDGGQLVSGAQGKLRVWSWDGQGLHDHYDLDVHGSSLGRPSFSADGRLLAVGTAEGLIQVWEVASRGTVWLTRQHGDFVNDVLFLPGDRPRLLSASDDSTVTLSPPCEACQDPAGFADRVASSHR